MDKEGREQQEQVLSDLEKMVSTQTKHKQIETAVLGSISLLGVASLALLAPNAVQILHKAFPDLQPVNQKQSVTRAIGRLIKNNLIEKKDGRYHVTSKGESRLQELTMLSGVEREEKWDKKWRVVIYDIPEKEKHKRDELRSMLMLTGFTKLQDSVWVYPFRCDEVVTLLKFKLKLGKRAVYMIVDAIENDRWLREYFGLPKDQ